MPKKKKPENTTESDSFTGEMETGEKSLSVEMKVDLVALQKAMEKWEEDKDDDDVTIIKNPPSVSSSTGLTVTMGDFHVREEIDLPKDQSKDSLMNWSGMRKKLKGKTVRGGGGEK